MKSKNQFDSIGKIKAIKESGEEFSSIDLVDFASTIDAHEINSNYLATIIETRNYRILSQPEKDAIAIQILIETPSSGIIKSCNMPESIFDFDNDQKNMFYERLMDHWSRLELRLNEFKYKITTERIKRNIP